MPPEIQTLNHLPIQPPATQRARDLARIVEMLTRAPAVRTELVEEIRRQLQTDGYMTEEKLDLAIERMLRDILA
jgi:hypothetical protein